MSTMSKQRMSATRAINRPDWRDLGHFKSGAARGIRAKRETWFHGTFAHAPYCVARPENVNNKISGF